ncbi:MAS protein, partial [Crotophaga sulcirostris]|nr:MAS protein [Crotophaga sulcirostris]
QTVTTDLSLNYMTSGYVDYRKIIEDACSELPYHLVVFAGVCMVISLCGLVGNGIVMWFLCSHMKQNPFTVYILNLAIADFSMLLLFFLLTLAILSLAAVCSSMYKYVAIYLEFLFVAEFLFHFFDLSSLSLLTAISTERCISVL